MKRPKTTPTGFTARPRRRSAAPADDQGQEQPRATPGSDAVRLVYVLERTRWERLKAGRRVSYAPPGTYDGTAPRLVDGNPKAVVGRGKPSVWKALADWLEARDLPPQDYVACAFMLTPIDRRHPPEPRQLMTETFRNLWLANRDKIEERILVALELQARRAEDMYYSEKDAEATEADAWACVLNNISSVDLSPLFRYCLAVQFGGARFRRIAAYFESAAILQFERFRGLYLRHWQALLPAGFPERAGARYPDLLENYLSA
jgi:hypothetical protein